MKATIYQLISPSGKSYIGSTKRNINIRLLEHETRLKNNRHENNILQNAWNKYNEFTVNILEEFEYLTFKDVTDKEQYYMNILKPEYNISELAVTSSGRTKIIIAKNITTKEEFKFNSIVEAETILKIKNTNISAVLTKKRKQTSDFVFKFEDDIIDLDNLIKEYLNSISQLSNSIIGINIKTKEIIEFDSINNAEKTLKLNSINQVLSGKRKQTSGYIFKYVNNNVDLNQLVDDYLLIKSKQIGRLKVEKTGRKVNIIRKIEF